MNLFEDIKPIGVWIICTAAGAIQANVAIISGLLSIGYTCYKIVTDYKKNKHNDKQG